MIPPSELITAAVKAGMYAFDIEHPPELDPHKPGFRLAGCSFATDGVAEYYTDISHIRTICLDLFPLNLEAIAFNGKYDLKCLVAAGVITSQQYPAILVDPMIGINLLDDNLRPNQLGLKYVMEAWYKKKVVTFEEAWRCGEHSLMFRNYGLADSMNELMIWKDIRPKLEQQGLLPLMLKVLGPASKVFADMETYGIGWDVARARALLRGFQELRNTMEKEIFAEIGELNIGSGDQVAKRLFNELGYPTKGLELTKSGARVSVDEKAMDTLAEKFPVCNKIRVWRTCSKMVNTYIEPCTRASMEDPKGRIHSTYWLVSATGRTRCEKPNFQNIPKWLIMRPEFKHLSIRSAVVAAPGKKLIVADFSQIELRLVAHIAQDPIFLKAYLRWKCPICNSEGDEATILHCCPKCGVAEREKHGFWHGLDLHQITTDSISALGGNRQAGKKANFALVYFATASKMYYEYPELSRAQWQDVIDGYFDLYAGVHTWHVRMERAMWESGVVVDIFGRKRRITPVEIRRNPKHALNMYINFAPQASACNMMLFSMVKIRQECLEKGIWLSDYWLSNMVHDEIVSEVWEKDVDTYIEVVKRNMENCVKLRVPVRADVKAQNTWGGGG